MSNEKTKTAVEQLKAWKNHPRYQDLRDDLSPKLDNAILELAERVEALEQYTHNADKTMKMLFDQQRPSNVIELPDDTFDALARAADHIASEECQVNLAVDLIENSTQLNVGSTTFVRRARESSNSDAQKK